MGWVKTWLIVWCVCVCSTIFADNTANKVFAELDQYFVQHYNDLARVMSQQARPLLTVDGFKYSLHLKDGSIKSFNGIVSPFNELKTISHLGPTLYAIAFSSWNNDNSWKEKLLALQVKIKNAQAHVAMINWNNSAWEDQAEKLKKFMSDSLNMVDHFITQILQKGRFTRSDYQEFSTHYMHSMITTMYLSNVGNTIAVLRQLQQWKQELGEEQWDQLYVVIMGTKGRTTAELTRETNTAAIAIAALLKPENIPSHVLIMPMASSFEHAELTLGEILLSKELATTTFITDRAKKVDGIYQALLTPEIPLARSNVQRITKKFVHGGKIDLPILDILPKDKTIISIR